jgi:ATP-dependent Clp protease ATP-binding subunit ClpA
MFQRFTDRARRVVVLAQEEARMLEHDYIGTEHLLLGLIHEGEGVAAKTLLALDVDLDTLRREVEALVGRGHGAARKGHIPFTPQAKKVLELALRESVQLGHRYIGTEHLLLGLVREGEGPASQVLSQRGIELDTVRQEVIRLLHGHQGAEGRRRRRIAWARYEGEGASPEEILRQLHAIGIRLSAIEDKLGVARSPDRERLRRIDAEIAKVRRQKESAIDEQDFERAAGLRDQEKRLLSERRAAEDAWLTAEDIPEAGPDAPADEPPGAASGQGDEPPGAASGQGDEPPGAASGQ